MNNAPKKQKSGIGETSKLLAILSAILVTGFGLSAFFNYVAAKDALRITIAEREMPMAIDGIYEHIQRDIVRPVIIASMMSDDSFIHEWISNGESDRRSMTRYLSEIKKRYRAYSALFVSDRTRRYYTGDGVLKTVSPGEPQAAWYYRLKGSDEPYELNIDFDEANKNAVTVFTNYRVVDSNGEFLGAIGVGLTMRFIDTTISGYARDFGASVYFADTAGRIMAGKPALLPAGAKFLDEVPGLGSFDPGETGGSGAHYSVVRRSGDEIFLAARYVPELKWWLFAEKRESPSIDRIEASLWMNLGICAAVMILVLVLSFLTVRRYQSRLEATATTDRLTGVMNRYAFEFAVDAVVKRCERDGSPISALMVDIDGFKLINDKRGHLVGDEALKAVSAGAKASLRNSDIICRWGGEEFLVALPGCALDNASTIAENLRASAARAAKPIVRLTVSAGVAQLRPGETFDSLTRRADEALLRAKRLGKDRSVAAR